MALVGFSISIINPDGRVILQDARAQQGEPQTIRIPEGAAVQTVDTSYIPENAEVQSGSEVTWANEDVVSHTSTSGAPAEGPSGQFDTRLIPPGGSASVTITSEAGTTIPYYCTVHPWLTASLTVVGAQEAPPEMPASPPAETAQSFLLSAELEGETYTINGTASPELNATSFTINPEESIEVGFQGSGNVNLTLPNVVVENVTSVTPTAVADNITFTVVEQTPDATTIGFEVPEDVNAVEISGVSVVPEFQTIALLMLGISVIAILAITRLKMQRNDHSGLSGRGL